MTRGLLYSVGAAALLAAWVVPGVSLAQIYREQSAAVMLAAAEVDSGQVENQLRNVARLLNASSGAQRVAGSDNVLAKQIREDGLKRYEEAQRAFAAGDLEAASRLSSEASRIMFQAIRVLGTQQESRDKKASDFEARAASVAVLIQALERIAEAEDESGKAAQTITGINTTVKRARALMAGGEHDEARRLLDGGYEMAKLAVDHLRDGKTLVRTLNFASAEEEYAYELDRNDTHLMLVKVLLEEKQPDEHKRAMVEQFVARSRQLRQEAQSQAGSGDFAGAIALLEQATKELVRAIRGAGIYIPG